MTGIGAFTDAPVAAEQRGLNLERIARAAAGGYEREQTLRVVTEETRAALDCDQVFLLKPAPRTDAVCVEAAAPVSGGVTPGEFWLLGERATHLFDRCFSHADCATEPYDTLAQVLREARFMSWVGLPLRRGRMGRSLGLLGIAACRPDAHLRWAGSLRSVAVAASEALAGNPDCTAAPTATPAAHDYERAHALYNLAFGISHAMGNVFGAILGNLYFLAEEESGGRRRELVQRIESSAYAGAEMMSSLQGFVGPPATGLQQVDLGAVAADVVGLTRRLCGPECGVLSIDLPERSVVWGHPARLRECLVNLLFNALWAGGEVVVSARAEDAGACSLSVRDTGPGMDEEVRRRATEPFFTTRPGHQGLGLSVARGIAVAHRGQLTIRSEPGRGTTVTVTVPTAPPGQSRMIEQLMAEALQGAR